MSRQYKLVVLFCFILTFSGCAKDECSLAKEQFIEYHRIYTQSVMNGIRGYSDPGVSETAVWLNVSRQKCNMPNLEIQDIVGEYVGNPKNCSKGDLWEMMYCRK